MSLVRTLVRSMSGPLVGLGLLAGLAAAALAQQPAPLSLIVMDPLAAPLSCPCVEGYAQRDYEQLATFLQDKTGLAVELSFCDSLEKALEKRKQRPVDVIIGKDSVVRSDAKTEKIPVRAVARLTGKEGATTQRGLIVVRANDPAQEVTDLNGYRIFFGPAECEEKYDAPMRLLKQHGVGLPTQIETSAACSDGACKVLELPDAVRAAAVISSYAAPLLEGCGTIKKGELRVVAETEPVPFVTAFVSQRMAAQQQQRVIQALMDVGTQPSLCQALESLIGFVPLEQAIADVAKKK